MFIILKSYTELVTEDTRGNKCLYYLVTLGRKKCGSCISKQTVLINTPLFVDMITKYLNQFTTTKFKVDPNTNRLFQKLTTKGKEGKNLQIGINTIGKISYDM